MAEGILGPGGRQLPDPRHARTIAAPCSSCCSTAACRTIGDPTQCHAVAIDARAPKFDGGIITRHDCVVFGIVVNKHAQRFYDEGEDIWPKRYAIWGRLVAAQPDQIAYIIFDSVVVDDASCRRCSRRSARRRIARTRRQARARSGRAREDRHRLQRRGAARHLRPHHPGRLPHRRPHAGEDALGAADRDRAVLRLSGAARHHLHLSRHAREQAVAHADEGRQARPPTCSRPARSWPATCSGAATPPASA